MLRYKNKHPIRDSSTAINDHHGNKKSTDHPIVWLDIARNFASHSLTYIQCIPSSNQGVERPIMRWYNVGYIEAVFSRI